MGSMSTTDIASMQIEGIQELIPELLKSETTLDSLFEDNGRSQRVGTIAYRIVVKHAKPATYKAGALDGPALPIGGGSKWDKGSITPQVLMLPVGWTKLAEMVGVKVDGVAIANAVEETMADAVDNLRTIRDQLLNTEGTGKLAVVLSVSGSTVTLAAATTYGFGARLLNEGQVVGIWNGTTLRGSVTIDQKPFDTIGGAQTFHFTGSDPGITAGDFVRCDGLTTGAPVFINGLSSFINTSTSGTLLGFTKANASFMVSNGYDLGGGQITLPAARLLITQVQGRKGKKALKGQIWHTHASQVAAYEELGFERQEITTDGAYKKMDLLFEDFALGGFPISPNNNADQTAWTFVLPKSWGKVHYGGDGPFFYEMPGAGKIYPLYDTSGAPLTQFGACLIDAKQYYCDDVLVNGVLTSCRVPTGN